MVAKRSRLADELVDELSRIRALSVRAATPRDVLDRPPARRRGMGRADVVLIDQSVGAGDSIATAIVVRKRFAGVPVILLGDHDRSRATAELVLRTGASTYVDTRSGVDGIARAILVALTSARAV
jgi:DNA-binding NarL/FixJ family response regulator